MGGDAVSEFGTVDLLKFHGPVAVVKCSIDGLVEKNGGSTAGF